MIYCVEDDRDIMQIMLYTLKSRGYEAKGFESGEEFWTAISQTKPDLVMLDIMLPGEDGLEILRKLRSNPQTKDIYIIMSTAKGSEYDKVMGLDGGRDYYLAKPFGMMEMLAYIRAVMRRSRKMVDTDNMKVGKIEMNNLRHNVYADGKEISLTGKEYEILKILMSYRGVVVSRDELQGKIWGYDYIVESRTIDVHVGALRAKLGACGEYIETVRGIGYRLEDKG